MSRFAVSNLPLAGLKLINRQLMGDSRGFLVRLFCADELAAAGWNKPVTQINHTYTARSGTVRGMHYQQSPHSEMKLVTCIRGEVWDVAVDLRADSETFLCWHAEILSSKNNRAMIIPEGFAHGFQTLSNDVEIMYCHTAAHNPDAESALNINDPRLAITWPLNIVELSSRDTIHEMINSNFEGVRI